MRKSTLLLAVLLALGCGSSTPSPRHMRIQLTELRPVGAQVMLSGTHYFRVRVMNDGTEPFTVESITLQLGASRDIELMNGVQSFHEEVAPGQTAAFDMSADVQVTRSMLGGANVSIQSLRVIINATGSAGSFFESGDYNVGPEIGG